MSNGVEIKNLTFRYAGCGYIFQDASFSCKSGESVCIIGENGTGKSTFLKILSNIVPCDFSLDFFDHNRSSIKNIAQHVGYVPDKPFLYDDLTGRENIQFIMGVFNENKQAYTTKVLSLCERFYLLEHLDVLVKHYSLGMKHKLFLAAILSRNVKVFLLDEPLTALDQGSQTVALDELLTVCDQGKCVVFTSHIKEIQQGLAHKTYLLKNGSFLEESL